MNSIDSEALIAAVEKHPIIWCTANKDYKDRQKKINVWKSICEEVVDNFATIEEDRNKQDIGKSLLVRFSHFAMVPNPRR